MYTKAQAVRSTIEMDKYNTIQYNQSIKYSFIDKKDNPPDTNTMISA